MTHLKTLAGRRYKADWDVYRGIDLIPCRHGKTGVRSGSAYYARAGSADSRSSGAGQLGTPDSR